MWPSRRPSMGFRRFLFAMMHQNGIVSSKHTQIIARRRDSRAIGARPGFGPQVLGSQRVGVIGQDCFVMLVRTAVKRVYVYSICRSTPGYMHDDCVCAEPGVVGRVVQLSSAQPRPSSHRTKPSRDRVVPSRLKSAPSCPPPARRQLYAQTSHSGFSSA